jgi:hypothetical protein
MDSPQQKFFVSDDGKDRLSLSKAELQAGIDSGKHGEKTLAWTKGMSEWLPLSDPYWDKHGIIIPPDLLSRPQVDKANKPSQSVITTILPNLSKISRKCHLCRNTLVWWEGKIECFQCNQRWDPRPEDQTQHLPTVTSRLEETQEVEGGFLAAWREGWAGATGEDDEGCMMMLMRLTFIVGILCMSILYHCGDSL